MRKIIMPITNVTRSQSSCSFFFLCQWYPLILFNVCLFLNKRILVTIFINPRKIFFSINVSHLFLIFCSFLPSIQKTGKHLSFVFIKTYKMASKKLRVLNKWRYFTPAHRLLLYKVQVRPHMEHCSHLWAGALHN